MKQGISLFSFAEDVNLKWAFEHAKKAGYDGVEPVLGEHGYLTPATPEREILAMRRMAAEHPIEKVGAQLRSMMSWLKK